MITANISRFTGQWAAMNAMGRQLNISLLELARCVMTVGQSGYSQVFNQGFWRLCSLFSLTYSNVDTNRRSLTLSNTFKGLQQSEKVTVSYHLGMGLAMASASNLMNVPWLVHLDSIPGVVLGSLNGQVPTKFQLHSTRKTAREPDLIGFDNQRNAHVFEGKGYSNGINTSELQHAIDQVSQVVTINGVAPATRTVMFSDLSPSPFLITIIDPDDDESIGYQMTVNFNSFLRTHYSVFAETNIWSNATLFSVGDNLFRAFPIGKPNYFFGIASRILDQLPNIFSSTITDRFTTLEAINPEILGDTLAIGQDGTILFDTSSKEVKHKAGA
jgi:hypothetical protein